MPDPNYQYGQYPANWWKPRGQGVKAQPSNIDVESAREKARRARYYGSPYFLTNYVPPTEAEKEKRLRDRRLQAFFARYGLEGMGTGPVEALKSAGESAANLVTAYNEKVKQLAIPGYVNPQTEALRKRYKQAGGTGYWKPKTAAAQTPTAPAATGLPSYLERFYAGAGPFGPPQPEETTPYTGGGYEGGGGYGGYGYPYYGGGGWGGGGVNINFGGGRQQQQIARLPTTPRPDIQGWLQSLINWNIG